MGPTKRSGEEKLGRAGKASRKQVGQTGAQENTERERERERERGRDIERERERER